MKVSSRVHYGLRAMTELARSYDEGGLLSISEIARNENLPLAYLEQLVGELRRASLVEGTRGMRGGYRLAKAPADVTVGDVYRVLEGEVAPVECTAEEYLPGGCSLDDSCMSRSVWGRVQQAILRILDSTTLADLLREEAQHAASHASFVPLDSLGASRPLMPDSVQGPGGGKHPHLIPPTPGPSRQREGDDQSRMAEKHVRAMAPERGGVLTAS